MAEEAKTRELNYVMVQHMGYSAETRAARRTHAGRGPLLTLDNGRRVRNKGDRFDEITFSDVLVNHETLLKGVLAGAIRVCRPDNLEPFTYAQLIDLIKRLAVDFKNDLKIDETLLEPLVGSDLKDERVWVEKPAPAVQAPSEAPSEASAKVEKHEPEVKAEAKSEESDAHSKHSMKKGRR